MSNTPHGEELRRQAEERLAAGESRIATLERADLARLAHELAVHQIELEIQNEELRRAQLEAQDARDRYLDLYDFAPVGYFTLDEHSRIAEANLTGCRLLSAERQGLLDTRFTKFLLPEETDKFYFHRRKVLEAGVGQTCELKMVKAGGTAFDARLESIRAGGERLRVAVTDVTERKRAEEAVRGSEERYHRLFEDDLSGDFISTPEGRILLCNPAFARMFQFSSVQEAVGASIVDLYVDPREREPLLQRLKQQRKIERLEVWRKRRDGKLICLVENIVGHFNERGELYEIQAYVFDDTERQRADEQLRELTRTLESKVTVRTSELAHRAGQLQKMTLEVSLAEDRERKRMAEILHDDLQQIIAGAKFHLSLLRNRAKHDPSVQAIGAQIDQMLKEAVEKSRGLSHELSPAVLHHGDFTETLDWLARQMQAKHGLVVHVRASGPAHLQSDAIRGFLYRAVQELLFNVAKHARVNEARIRLRRRGQCVCLSISDRGRGFDPQELQEAAGYGLLSIRERVALLGGRMKIRSAKGKGSTFYVVVPDRAAATAGAQGKRHGTARRKKLDVPRPRAEADCVCCWQTITGSCGRACACCCARSTISKSWAKRRTGVRPWTWPCGWSRT